MVTCDRFVMSLPFRLLLLLVRASPIWLGRRVGAAIGSIAFVLAPATRQRILDSLSIAFGATAKPRELRALAHANLRDLGMTLFELLKLPFMAPEEVLALCPLEGMQNLKPFAGKPAVFITGHIGNLAVLLSSLTLQGYRATVIARPFSNPSMRALVLLLTERMKFGLIERAGKRVGPLCLEVLRRGEALYLGTDQDAGSKGVFVEFFGQPASTFLGAARFARSEKAPVIPMYTVRLPDGSLRGFIEPPMEIDLTGDDEKDDSTNTARHTAILERWVRQYPASYLWLHRRWKTQPPVTPPAQPSPQPGAKP